MPHENRIAARKPAPNYRDPNDSPKPDDSQKDDGVSQEAAENRKPADKYGNTEPVDETNEKTRHADGRNPPGKPNPEKPNIEKPGGSEQPGYRMKRAPFWQS
ncbi:hypothetical protein [Aminobacter ciceronei]|jgi:hypothetical protein|uniref:hypothetical protein n=1 Tax=Aminobacter ciceronei TaxID=150723 RepID=UPI003F72A791